MWDLNGTVDHYVSRDNRRDLAFEWSNFRYISGWLNSSKQTLDQEVLDPFRVEIAWFEIVLPSLVMQLTPCVPKRIRPVAEFTLTRLHLADGDRVYEQRRIYYDSFVTKNRPIDWLEKYAPVLATFGAKGTSLSSSGGQSDCVSIEVAADLCEVFTRSSLRTSQDVGSCWTSCEPRSRPRRSLCEGIGCDKCPMGIVSEHLVGLVTKQEELLEGNYEWSSMGKLPRRKGIVK